ncbi:PREDICTED: proton-coupled folate transporter-like isoform X2 [Dinoponera quadriceps]|uniref:Proton-coupled folate transporter-like isoform X2 n=1 Tax=Dinoponera quadriceps TaxID=609295 RepID=A0A6P3Y073_DINQU|nr:PREDICTED: proton-coupled folate transporter-like isoform X2 [Dinoponera quadriceps]
MDQIVTGWRRYVMVQPSIMLMLIAQSMSGTILTDLIIYRTCTVTLRINQTECLILHNNGSSPEALKINLQVQPHVSLILMSKSFIESIFPSFLSLFLGPWSDKYGRKPLILSGYTAFVPAALLGGLCVLVLASLCYITDITNDNERSWHLAWLDALISLGLLIGLFSGPAILEAYGYTAVFGIATVLCIAATLYILLFVPETIQNHSTGAICKIFDFVLVKDLVRACIKKREGFNRSLVWSCIVCLTLLLITLQGELTIGYLFASARLSWNVKQYSTYVGVSVVLGIFGTILGIKLMRQCAELPEAIIAIISVISSLSSSLMRAFIWQSWHMYLATSMGSFSDLSRPMIRAVLSKTVPLQDMGKIFSLTSSLETLLPFAAASLYTFLYSHYMPPVYPVPVWFLSAAFYIMTIILLINIQIMIKRHNTCYVSLRDNSD